MTRTNAPVIDVYLPSLDETAKVQLMERPDDLNDYAPDQGPMGMDAHLDVVTDHVLEPDLDRDQVEKLDVRDVAALFGQIVQDATNKAAVPGPDQGNRS